MNKKILGIKISTILTVLACLIVSIVIWTIVKYNLNNTPEESAVAALQACPFLRG